MGEIGFVGDGPNSYQLWLGGNPAQTQLAEPYMERMKIQVQPLLWCWPETPPVPTAVSMSGSGCTLHPVCGSYS